MLSALITSIQLSPFVRPLRTVLRGSLDPTPPTARMETLTMSVHDPGLSRAPPRLLSANGNSLANSFANARRPLCVMPFFRKSLARWTSRDASSRTGDTFVSDVDGRERRLSRLRLTVYNKRPAIVSNVNDCLPGDWIFT